MAWMLCCLWLGWDGRLNVPFHGEGSSSGLGSAEGPVMGEVRIRISWMSRVREAGIREAAETAKPENSGWW